MGKWIDLGRWSKTKKGQKKKATHGKRSVLDVKNETSRDPPGNSVPFSPDTEVLERNRNNRKSTGRLCHCFHRKGLSGRVVKGRQREKERRRRRRGTRRSATESDQFLFSFFFSFISLSSPPSHFFLLSRCVSPFFSRRFIVFIKLSRVTDTR